MTIENCGEVLCSGGLTSLKLADRFCYSASLSSRFSFRRSSTFLESVCAQNPNGALRGEIQDATAARVPGAQVVVKAAGSSISRSETANGQGEFRIEGLLPGSFRVIVTAKSFAQATADVDIAVSVVRDINVTLKPKVGTRDSKRAGNTFFDHDAKPLTFRARCMGASLAARTSNLSRYPRAASPILLISFPELSRWNLLTLPRRASLPCPPGEARA